MILIGVGKIAIGITNQRETALVWDRKDGKSLHSAIVWSDTRTHDIVKKINSNKDKAVLVRDLSGLPVTTYFSAVKYKWLLENSSAVQTAVESGDAMFGTIDSWLMYHLTGGASQGGVHVTDVTNASRTLLMNLKSLKWDPILLNIFNVPESVLPKIVSSAEVYGHVQSGPLAGIPVAGCLGDQQAALVGQKCFEKVGISGKISMRITRNAQYLFFFFSDVHRAMLRIRSALALSCFSILVMSH